MRLIAHRGFAGAHPENTLAAVRSAAARADAVEVDARRCGSGEVVVIHDETVDRVTDDIGRVDERTRAELDAMSVDGSGEGVPTLVEVVAALPDRVGLVLDLKEVGLAEDAVAAARAAGVDDLFVSSFHRDALVECRDIDADVALGLNVAGDGDGTGSAGVNDDGEGSRAGLSQSLDLDCSAVHPHHELCSAEYVERAQDVGLAVNAWTVVERSTARRLVDVGVDGIIADRPDVVDEVARG